MMAANSDGAQDAQEIQAKGLIRTLLNDYESDDAVLLHKIVVRVNELQPASDEIEIMRERMQTLEEVAAHVELLKLQAAEHQASAALWAKKRALIRELMD